MCVFLHFLHITCQPHPLAQPRTASFDESEAAPPLAAHEHALEKIDALWEHRCIPRTDDGGGGDGDKGRFHIAGDQVDS
jgi:hypothetical protein